MIKKFLSTDNTYNISMSEHLLLLSVFRHLYEQNFPESIRIKEDDLVKISGMSKRTIERARKRLTTYKINGEYLLKYENRRYSINYNLFKDEITDETNNNQNNDQKSHNDAYEIIQQNDVYMLNKSQFDANNTQRQTGAISFTNDDFNRVFNIRHNDDNNKMRQTDYNKTRQFDDTTIRHNDGNNEMRQFDDISMRHDDDNNEMRQVGHNKMRQNGDDIERQGDVNKKLQQIDVVDNSDTNTARSIVDTGVGGTSSSFGTKVANNIYNNNIYIPGEEEYNNLKYSSSSTIGGVHIQEDGVIIEEKEKEKYKKEKEREVTGFESKGRNPVGNETQLDATMRYWYYELPLAERKSYSKLTVMLIERVDKDYFLRNKCGVLNDLKRMMMVRIGVEYTIDPDRVIAVTAKVASTIKNPAYMIQFIHNELFPEDKIGTE